MPAGTIEQGDANVSDGATAASVTDVVVIAANANRRSASIYNDSSSACYVRFGAAATTTAFKYKIPANGYYELPLPCFTGDVHALWDSATGSVRWSQETA